MTLAKVAKETTFSKNMRIVRESKGMSQAALAKKCEMTSQMISNYELGKNEPQLYSALRIADALDVDIKDLLAIA